MTVKKIKDEMKQYRDFYGGALLGIDDIEKINSKKELAKILKRHRNHMEDMLNDANSSVDRLTKKLGLELFI